MSTPSGPGLWQYVVTDGTLYPTTSADKYDVFIACSGNLANIASISWSEWDAYREFAERHFATTIDQLLMYYYSDTPGVVQIITAAMALDVLARIQPKRVVQNYAVNLTTGLMTRAGGIIVTDQLFQAASPLSRMSPTA